VLALVINAGLLLLAQQLTLGFLVTRDWENNIFLLLGIPFFLLHLIDIPFFSRPSDALPNSIAAFLTLVSLRANAKPAALEPIAAFLGFIGLVLTVLVSVTAIVALLYDKRKLPRTSRGAIANIIGHRISNDFGRGELLFSFPFVVSVLLFEGLSIHQVVFCSLAWALIVLLKPVEFGLRLLNEISHQMTGSSPQVIGFITRIDSPSVVRVQLLAGLSWPSTGCLLTRLPNGEAWALMPVYCHDQDNNVIGTAFMISQLAEDQAMALVLGIGEIAHCPESLPSKDKLVNRADEFRNGMAGFVVEESSIARIRFEALPFARLHEGAIVRVLNGDSIVYYQVLDGHTGEETFEGNPKGREIAYATQLGYLEDNRFRKFRWVPSMNTLVRFSEGLVRDDAEVPAGKIALGHLPNTQFEVLADLHELVLYHTAVLGVTGTGKTELVFDIIRASVRAGMKVFCVDFTGEYRARLADLGPIALGLTEVEANDLDKRLFDVETGEYGAKNEKFLEGESYAIGLFELPGIINTKATLRATELYLSAIMDWARAHRKARTILIALEEAHTIIPEVYGSGFDNDTQWIVGRISQIALQGRKFGVGLLVISQRTALVSKSILSQCNTHICFGLVDKTSLDYLSNVYSSEYVRAIPSLGKLEALVYGKAIHSDQPILVRIPFDEKKLRASEELSVDLTDAKAAPANSPESHGPMAAPADAKVAAEHQDSGTDLLGGS
jgi:hypothetical protein